MILTVTVIDSTGITLSGDQTEISVVNPATSVTYNPTAPFTATNVQDALPQAHKMIGEQTNDYSVTLNSTYKFEIKSGSSYGKLTAAGGQAGWNTDIVSSENIRLFADNSLSVDISDGVINLHDLVLMDRATSGNYTQGHFRTNFQSTAGQHHYVLQANGTTKGYIGASSDGIFIGNGSRSINLGGGFFGQQLYPANFQGASQDGQISLGKSNARFADLHLSDDLYANGVEFVNGNITFDTNAFVVKNALQATLIDTDSNSVNLRYNGTARLETTQSGVNITGTATSESVQAGNITATGNIQGANLLITGDMTVSGDIDGRDVSVDGAKLDTIESGATADQTDAEIRAAVDAATDSNVYTDAEKAKLTGIESGATADQTDDEIRTAVGNAANSNVFTDFHLSKVTQAPSLLTDNNFGGEILAQGLNVDSGTLAVDATNNRVGIGSPFPDYRLSVVDTGTSTIQIKAGNANYSQLNFGDIDDGDIGQIAYVHDSDEMRFRTNNSQGMVIDSSGNLGIGTGNPDNALHVEAEEDVAVRIETTHSSGDAKVRFKTQNSLGWTIGANDNDSFTFTDADNLYTPFVIENGAGSGTLTVDSNSRVGIGTTSPSSELDVIGKTKITYPQADILYIKRDHVSDANTVITFDQPTKNTYIGADPNNHFVIGNTLNLQVQNIARFRDNYDVSFYEDTGTTPKFSWDASAESLGIGTSTPNARLHVTSNAGQSDIAKFGSASQSTYSKVDFDTDNSAGDKYIIAYGSLHSTQANDFAMKNNTVNGDILFATQTGTQMTIKSNGVVGIGTTSPTESLHTSGNIRFGDTTPAELYTNSNELRLGVDKNNDNTESNITFYVNNSEKGRFDKDGDFGIGTTNPLNRLHVASSGSNFATLRLDSPENTTPATFQVRAHDGLFDIRDVNQSATRLTISSSGNVGMGNTTTPQRLTVGEGVATIGLQPDDTNGSYIRVGGTGASTNILRILGHSDTEKARFDSSGNLLVATTDNSPVGNNVAGGIALLANGSGQFSRDGGTALLLNRKGNDGELLRFNKNSAIVGSIGVDNSDNLFIEGNSSHSGLQFATNTIIPHKNGSNIDATIALGSTTNRFKELKLSDGVFLGGTGSANKLDDYEEGTWTPTASTNVDNLTNPSGSYTKIGRQVTVTFSFTVDLAQNQTFYVGGLPFQVRDNLANTAIEATGVTFSDNHYKLLYASHGSTQLVFAGDIAGTQEEPAFYRGSITYFTT